MSLAKSLQSTKIADEAWSQELRQFIAQHTGKSPDVRSIEPLEESVKILLTIVKLSLLKEPSVDDCVVLLRKTETSQRELIAYIVSAGSFSSERLQSYLKDILPEALQPKAYVRVSALPLDAKGQVDESALMGLEIIDADLVQRWQERLKLQPEIEKAAILVREYAKNIPPLHLKDLLPNWNNSQETIAFSENNEYSAIAPPETAQSPVPAISHGEPLHLSKDDPQTLAEILIRAAKKSTHQGITYLHSDGSQTFQSYAALLQEAQQILAGLRKLGLQPQDKVIFQLNQNQTLIPAFWGCLLGGFVPVPISTAASYDDLFNTNVKKLQNAWQILERPLVLTDDSLAPQIRAFSAQLNLENFQVETIETLRSHPPDLNSHLSQPDDLALLLLTSGSTGLPKGVVLTHGNIISSVAGTSQMSHLTREDISLNWLPLDHPGPLIRCVIRCVFLGCQQMHAPTGLVLQDILKWLDWIERYGVTTTWAPNFAYALLGDRKEELEKRRWDLSSVRSLLNTAEPIVPQTARKVLDLLVPHGLAPNAMHSSWGMAETSSGVTGSDRYLIDSPIPKYASFAELGSPIPGISLRIVNDKNEVVNEGTIGYLHVKGATVTAGYYNNPEMNREVFTEDGWFNTGDLGFLHQGRLTITGRTKNIIIVNGVNYYTHEIEAVVEATEGVEVSYTAACAIRKPGSNTDELIVFFHPSSSEGDRLAELLKEIRRNVASQLGVKPSYLIPIEKEAIPKTSIGKIQHAQLKKSFEAGDFEAIVKRIDILLGNENTLPDWFYRPIWRQKKAIALENKVKPGQCLVFLDALGLGEYLCGELGKLKQRCVGVETGLNFAKLADDRYRIDPKNPDHYRKLIESVSTQKLPVEQILHLWTYDEFFGEISSLEALEETQQRGISSLLFLVQALEKVQSSDVSVRLQVVASYSQATSTQEKIACDRTPLLGLVKTIPQELTWIDCRHLDLPVQANKVNATYILQELQVIQKEPEVAYRNGQRLISRLEKVDLLEEETRQLPFKKGGSYLITGGLGGIGTEIAKYLLENYQARLLLVGRTPLPERRTWEAHLQQNDAVSERIKAFMALEKLAGSVSYEAVDICDLNQLQQGVDRAKENWQCELNGVIHLAGITTRRLLVEETPDSLAATFRPKVFGTWVLHQLVKNQPDSVFISFSSVNGFFGGFSAGAYAAANRFLDAFSHYQRQMCWLQSYCFAWSMWDEMGMSRNYQMKDLTRARGYCIISPEQGLHSFFVGLHRNWGHLLVGLDGSNSYMTPYVEREAYQTQQLCAYFTARTAIPVAQLQGEEMRDRFGTSSTCEFRQLPEMPLTESGEIDIDRIAATGRQSTADRVAPRTAIERELAQIWQELLSASNLSIRDNFFELGGTSVLALRLFSRIEQRFGKNLPLATLFQAPTIEKLAHLLQQEESSVPWRSLVPIQPNGSKKPLFCVHAVGGNILSYQNIAYYLGQDQPVYGLQAKGLDGKQAPHTKVEDMAAEYIQEIRIFQPKGPYYLAGHSLGGIVAFEMAQQLVAAGEKVALLAFFDSHSPTYSFKKPPLSYQLYIHWFNLKRIDRKEKLTYILDRIKWNAERAIQKIIDLFYALSGRSLPNQIPESFLLTEEANREAVKNYVPQVYPGSITLFRAIERPTRHYYDPNMGWGDLAAKGVEIQEVPGHHITLIFEPRVRVLALKLKDCLERAQ